MNRINKAIKLAIEIHNGQVDKGNNPYILHPLRVLCSVEKKVRNQNVLDRESLLCSAVLHDVIEDSKDKDSIRSIVSEEFGDITYKTVETLTRKNNVSWNKYIDQLKSHWVPRIIKIADLEDNLDSSRLKYFTEKDEKRNRMYSETLKKLLDYDKICAR